MMLQINRVVHTKTRNRSINPCPCDAKSGECSFKKKWGTLDGDVNLRMDVGGILIVVRVVVLQNVKTRTGKAESRCRLKPTAGACVDTASGVPRPSMSFPFELIP